MTIATTHPCKYKRKPHVVLPQTSRTASVLPVIESSSCVAIWWPQHMIHIIFILIKPLTEPSFPLWKHLHSLCFCTHLFRRSSIWHQFVCLTHIWRHHLYWSGSLRMTCWLSLSCFVASSPVISYTVSTLNVVHHFYVWQWIVLWRFVSVPGNCGH